MVVVFHADVAYVVQVWFPLPHGENGDEGKGIEEDSGPHMEENTEVHCLVHPEIIRKSLLSNMQYT